MIGNGLAVAIGSLASRLRCGYGAIGIDEEAAADLRRTVEAAGSDRATYRIRPEADPGDSALDRSMELLAGLHDLGGVCSFELWGRERTEFALSIPRELRADLAGLFDAIFPEAAVSERRDPFPAVRAGEHVAGAELRLRNDYCLQIANPLGADRLDTEPYNGIVAAMREAPDGVRTIVQAVFEPAPDDWRERWYIPLVPKLSGDPDEALWERLPLVPREYTCGDVAARLERAGADRWTVGVVDARGEPAFTVDLRVIAVAPGPEPARAAARTIADRLATAYDDPKTDQGFRACGVTDGRLDDELRRVATRQPTYRRVRLAKRQREPCVLTVPELAGVAHLPSRTPGDAYALTTPGVDWKASEADEPSAGGDRDR